MSTLSKGKGRSRLSGQSNTDALLADIIDDRVDAEKAGILGRNLWHRGLIMVEIQRRVHREMAEAEERRDETLVKSLRRKIPSKRKIDVIKRNRKERDARSNTSGG